MYFHCQANLQHAGTRSISSKTISNLIIKYFNWSTVSRVFQASLQPVANKVTARCTKWETHQNHLKELFAWGSAATHQQNVESNICVAECFSSHVIFICNTAFYSMGFCASEFFRIVATRLRRKHFQNCSTWDLLKQKHTDWEFFWLSEHNTEFLAGTTCEKENSLWKHTKKAAPNQRSRFSSTTLGKGKHKMHKV